MSWISALCSRPAGARPSAAREGAELFHGTLIAGLAEWIGRYAKQMGQTDIVLGGGCFMNRVLAEGLASALRDRGLIPWLPAPCPRTTAGFRSGRRPWRGRI
jgi:hydrogenase maturation protein HypF